jgi:uncharacterized membrane protein
MSDESSEPSESAEAVAGFVERYGKRIVSIFAALAGAIGVFHVIGFVIVNVNLLNYGVFEVALPQVGYVAPGVSFVALVVVMSLTSMLLFSLSVRVLTKLGGPLNKTHVPEIIGGLIGLALIGFAAVTLAYGLWSLRGFSREVGIFCGVIGALALILIFAEDLPMINIIAQRWLRIASGSAEGVMQRLEYRLKSPAFWVALLIIMFVLAVSYGQAVYDKVPAVFGGGLPTIVRFYGPDVKKLESIGVHTEPGQADLTERVSLIAQSADRYIVLVDRRAVSFDQKFVQGIRYELPDFFLDRSFIWQDHTRLADRLAANNDLNGALSEYEFVLNDAAEYVPALRGHAQVLLQLERLADALLDYRALAQIEASNLENFYTLAVISEKVREKPDAGLLIKVSDVISPLLQATSLNAAYWERARNDDTFLQLRGVDEFDRSIYGGGVNAARYFAARADGLGERQRDGGHSILSMGDHLQHDLCRCAQRPVGSRSGRAAHSTRRVVQSTRSVVTRSRARIFIGRRCHQLIKPHLLDRARRFLQHARQRSGRCGQCVEVLSIGFGLADRSERP